MGAAKDAGKAARDKWLATATVMLGTFAMVLEATILTVALPQLMGVFDADQQAVQWLVTGFLAAMTATMLVSAWSVGRFGVRATFIGAMVLFCAASLMGALATDLNTLILARVCQGAAAGVIQPIGMIVIFEVFAADERGKGFGVYGLGVILGPTIAPTLGGLLVDLSSWRATFLVALPACLIALAMAPRRLPVRRAVDPPRSRLDVVGFVLLVGALTALLWSMASGARRGWDDEWALLVLALGLLGGLVFVAWEWWNPAPLLDLRVFRSRAFAGGFVITLALGAGLYASTYLLPQYLQRVTGLSAGEAGIAMLPAGMAMAFTFPVAGWIADRMPKTIPIVVGGGMFAVSCFMVANSADGGTLSLLLAAIALGRIGLGLMMPPITAAAMAGLAPEDAAQGAGAVNLARQMGGSLGVGLIAVVLNLAMDAGSAEHGSPAHGYAVAFVTLGIGVAVSLLAVMAMRRER